MADEDPAKRAGHILALVLVAALIAAVVIAALVSPWLATRLQADFWPVDRSYVSPNLTAAAVQAVIVVALVSIFYPPLRHAIERFVQKHKDELKAHAEAGWNEVHAKLDHIIHHSSDIPEFEPPPDLDAEGP